MKSEDVQLATEWAALYRMRGLQPLPSRTDEKRPLVRFADWWEAQAPTDLFERHQTTNIQVMTGRFWRLLVIDLDGPEAILRFHKQGRIPRTWQTHSGGAGRHVWFRISNDMPDMPKAFLWKGEGKHEAIERLCDRSLVMAPPSIHPGTGNRYKFVEGLPNPLNSVPAMAPAWVLALKPIQAPALVPPTALVRQPALRVSRVAGHYHRADVIASIPSIPALAASWGVRIAGKATQRGWVPCHAVDRQDDRASAAIHQHTGQYVDRGSGVSLSLFDLAARLKIYHDWQDAIQQLGAQFHVSRSA